MVKTNKFLMYDLNAGGFIAQDGSVQSNSIQDGAIFSEETATQTVVSVDEESYLRVPMTQQFVDAIPFDLVDTAPDIPFSPDANNEELMSGDFVVLNDAGFFDEKYNSRTNTSRPKVRGYDLNYANLYNMDILKEQGTEWIIYPDGGTPGIIVPVSEVQQEKLKALPEFSPTKEPYGFFMTPIGESRRIERGAEGENVPDLGDALAQLETDQSQNVDLPWEM